MVSCIVHVADQSNHPWPLGFIDHEAVHHLVLFKPGSMLFYESLCPHGRAPEFEGVVIKTSVMAEYVLFVRSNCGVVVRANAIARVGLI